jgi:hypothetical protein
MGQWYKEFDTPYFFFAKKDSSLTTLLARIHLDLGFWG